MADTMPTIDGTHDAPDRLIAKSRDYVEREVRPLVSPVSRNVYPQVAQSAARLAYAVRRSFTLASKAQDVSYTDAYDAPWETARADVKDLYTKAFGDITDRIAGGFMTYRIAMGELGRTMAPMSIPHDALGFFCGRAIAHSISRTLIDEGYTFAPQPHDWKKKTTPYLLPVAYTARPDTDTVFGGYRDAMMRYETGYAGYAVFVAARCEWYGLWLHRAPMFVTTRPDADMNVSLASGLSPKARGHEPIHGVFTTYGGAWDYLISHEAAWVVSGRNIPFPGLVDDIVAAGGLGPDDAALAANAKQPPATIMRMGYGDGFTDEHPLPVLP